MKLAARDIPSFVASPDQKARAVLIYGPDGGLVRERSKAIMAAILGRNADPLSKAELMGDQLRADPALLRDELAALSLIGGRRLITLQNAGEKCAPLISAAFEDLHTTTYLIVEEGELPAASALRSLFERRDDFAALACYRDEGRALEDTIRAALARHGLRAGSDAVQYLIHNLGNDRGVTARELEKIALYMGHEKEVTLEVAMELTGDNGSETIEDICHAVAAGDSAKAHDLLGQLLHAGDQPVAIIRSLMKHFQRLDIAAAHIGSGQSADQAVAALRPPVFFKYIPLVKRELSHLSARQIMQILTLLLRAEKDLKSSLLPPALLASHTVQQAARMAA